LRNTTLTNWARLGLLVGGVVAALSYEHSSLPQSLNAVPTFQRSDRRAPNRSDQTYGPAIKLADLKDSAIKESSGLEASRTTPGLYWTHNDSGDGPFIYAFDKSGERKGVWRVRGAAARDWEDMAAGPGPERNRHYLYLGDIGDNAGRRSEIVVYRVAEPIVTAPDASSSKSKPLLTDPAESIRLRYPDGSHDAEALLVHPRSGDLYVITKATVSNPVIYKAAAPLSTDRVNALTRIGELNMPGFFGGMVTGGAISPDGRRVALCDYTQGYELVASRGESFDSIWKQPLKTIALGDRRQGESITYRLDGKALLATSERLPTPLIQVERR